LDELNTLGAWAIWGRDLIGQSPSWLTSMVIHLTALIILALLTLPRDVTRGIQDLLAQTGGESGDRLDALPELSLDSAPSAVIDALRPVAMVPSGDREPALVVPREVGPAGVSRVTLDKIGLGRSDGDLLGRVGEHGPTGTIRDRGTEFEKRRDTPEGRALVAALQWLADHQLPDGGWSFDHTRAGGCSGRCRNPGRLAEARIAATGLALLPFLGAGQTHQQGRYKMTVRRGLYFLANRMRFSDRGGSFCEAGGRMYAHGIASIAMCEAYALTHDKGLHLPAQRALDFIGYAQDPIGGGWRYEPRQRGDTSVLGWQIMALKSGHLAYLAVPPDVSRLATAFLDGVQYDSGSRYGYTDAGQGSSATTAIGLLCRMYLGWKKDEPALQRGVDWLGRKGPAPSDMYYNYYATMVLRHFGGKPWRTWDAVMRSQLIDSQATDGHEAGSWYFKHSHAEQGGRLYCTAMAAMILEVYYRILPIYAQRSVEDDFPL
jgi:hypothetical protein